MAARILVIEDNPANLELMSYLLNAFGHTVLCAWDGEAGLEAARRENPDLIVCDIQIPKVHGFEVARQLKNHPWLKKIPLVAVTAFAMVGDRDKVLAAGFDGYIAKPIMPDTFTEQVCAFLPVAPKPEPEPEKQPAPVTTIARGREARATILVVDDSPVNIELARSILEPIGYEVLEASGTSNALELMRDLTPDLVLSDVHMHPRTGFDLIKSMKSDKRLEQIPFVLISSTVWQERDRLNGLDLGAVRFILRPTDPEVLLDEIETCLRERRFAGNGDDTGSR